MAYVGKEVLTSMAHQKEVDQAISRLKKAGATEIRYDTTEVSHPYGYTRKVCLLGYK